MKIWISKYALSAGITEHECEAPKEGSDRVYPGAPFMAFYGFTLGKDAHDTREGAVAAAEKMRKRKVASVRKQLQRLEDMTF